MFQLNISFSADLFLPEGNCFIQPALCIGALACGHCMGSIIIHMVDMRHMVAGQCLFQNRPCADQHMVIRVMSFLPYQ